MQKGIIGALFLGLIILAAANFTSIKEPAPTDKSTVVAKESSVLQFTDTTDTSPQITPISHATFVLQAGDVTIFNDPVGDPALFESFKTPDYVLVSDVHGDHLSVETLEAVVVDGVKLIVPQAVYDELSPALQSKATILSNGEELSDDINFLSIEAFPMYNLPTEGPDYRHVKGRGNGYILTLFGGQKVYIAGDTEDIEEMRALENIDIAFIPMNLPYTMDVAAAADGVLAFAPKQVYPYHYRGPDGLSDVEEFKRLVNESNPDIEVVLLDWYAD